MVILGTLWDDFNGFYINFGIIVDPPYPPFWCSRLGAVHILPILPVSLLDATWEPTWLHFGGQLGTMLATFSAKMGRLCGSLASFLLHCFFQPICLEFLAPEADGVPHIWPPSPMGYPIFGQFLDPIWCQLGAILGHFGARAGPGWAGGVTPVSYTHLTLPTILLV